MSGIKRLNLMALMQVKSELENNYAMAAVRYGLDKANARALLEMEADEIIDVAVSTNEPVFVLKPVVGDLRAHARGSEFHMLMSANRSLSR